VRIPGLDPGSRICGYGVIDQIARMVQALIGLRSLPRADATDALAVAITHGRAVQPRAVRLTSAVVRARPRDPRT
jgi:Holliday junction resolvasome RuvABC endonuclease subunit